MAVKDSSGAKPRQRDHAATLRRRNEIARGQGFKSYADKRKQLRYANTSQDFIFVAGSARGDSRVEVERVKLFYKAFHDDPNNYAVGSPKAEWFVGIEQLMTYEEWANHYPRGVREYTRLFAAA